MSEQTSIEWTDSTWNPVTGCHKISPGCKNCYAARLAPRLKAMGNPRYADGFKVTLHHDLVELPTKWAKPRKIFVNSMSDLFHAEVPLYFVRAVFLTIVVAEQHTFQLLTKRPERALEMAGQLPWPKNLWMGVSVENPDYLHRVDTLRRIPAQTRFLSLEPLIEAIPHIDLDSIDWVIAGGESGPGAREIKEDWVRSIRDQCDNAGVRFFFKQWGGTNKKRSGRTLDDRTWDDFPPAKSCQPTSLDSERTPNH